MNSTEITFTFADGALWANYRNNGSVRHFIGNAPTVDEARAMARGFRDGIRFATSRLQEFTFGDLPSAMKSESR